MIHFIRGRWFLVLCMLTGGLLPLTLGYSWINVSLSDSGRGNGSDDEESEDEDESSLDITFINKMKPKNKRFSVGVRALPNTKDSTTGPITNVTHKNQKVTYPEKTKGFLFSAHKDQTEEYCEGEDLNGGIFRGIPEGRVVVTFENPTGGETFPKCSVTIKAWDSDSDLE